MPNSDSPYRLTGSNPGPAAAILTITGLFLIVAGAWTQTNYFLTDTLVWLVSRLAGQGPAATFSESVQRYGWDAMCKGALLAALGSAMLLGVNFPRSWTEKKHLWTWAAVAVLVSLWLPVAVHGHTTVISGDRYWWLFEDQMISMRFARNLASGAGLVWNPGERVEGFSNFLWTTYMALVHLLPIPDSRTSLVVLITNVAIAACIVPILVRLVRVLGGGPVSIIATLAGYVLSKNIMFWTIEGTETALVTLAFLYAAYRVLLDSQQGIASLSTYAAIGALSLVRADAVVLSGLLCMLSFTLNANKRGVLLGMVGSVAIPAGYLLFRIWYYGDVLPNTAYLKVMNWQGRYYAGLVYIAHFMARYVAVIPTAVIGSMISGVRARRYLLLLLLVDLAYVVSVGGDAFQDFRFLVPTIPLWMGLAFMAIEDLRLGTQARLAACAVVLVSVPLVISPSYLIYLSPPELNAGDVRLGELIRLNTPESAKVAAHRVGTTLYFSRRPGIDMLGKCDRHVARGPAVNYGTPTRPGHNKFDLDHSLGDLRPDLVIGFFSLPVDEDRLKRDSVGDLPYIGQLYFNPLFEKHCLPNPVAVETGQTVFFCDWSPLKQLMSPWKPLP